MKIFNWVHRSFHHKVFCADGLGRNVKKDEVVANIDADTQVLLEHVTLVDVLDGILTIGTLGFDPLKDFNEKTEYPIAYKEPSEECDGEGEEYLVDDHEYEDNEMEDEELNPLVLTALRHGFEKDSAAALNSDDQNAGKADLIMTIDGTPLSSRPLEFGLDSNNDKRKKRSGERTTLADLFSAESDASTKPDHGKVQTEASKKAALQVKNGRSFAKKIIPRVGEDSRPIQKLQRLMTRMLKRKIHPDLEGKIHGKESQTKANILGLGNDKYGANNESVSLLQTQDAIV
ncbi:hypothetical protein F0562_019387 [Nyssa sinensis]|uniref:Protein TILLER ANGLE CONTROL 1 n=1 Tax=Nyssa sinensis TaxID=561372 RepID=A0A5J4ZFA4_9ASTE|nr:hypothetical protein F0562_019387 [Nyssa sinensis]